MSGLDLSVMRVKRSNEEQPGGAVRGLTRLRAVAVRRLAPFERAPEPSRRVDHESMGVHSLPQ